MDWKLILFSFVTIFIAELGDKTQIASMGLATKNGDKMLSVFIGVLLGFIFTTLIAILGARILVKYFPENVIKYIAGGLLVGSGLWMIIRG